MPEKTFQHKYEIGEEVEFEGKLQTVKSISFYTGCNEPIYDFKGHGFYCNESKVKHPNPLEKAMKLLQNEIDFYGSHDNNKLSVDLTALKSILKLLKEASTERS